MELKISRKKFRKLAFFVGTALILLGTYFFIFEIPKKQYQLEEKNQEALFRRDSCFYHRSISNFLTIGLNDVFIMEQIDNNSQVLSYMKKRVESDSLLLPSYFYNCLGKELDDKTFEKWASLGLPERLSEYSSMVRKQFNGSSNGSKMMHISTYSDETIAMKRNLDRWSWWSAILQIMGLLINQIALFDLLWDKK